MKTAFIYGWLLSLSLIACKKDVDTPILSPGCVDSSLYGTNSSVFGKWTLVAARVNPNVIFGGKPGDFVARCGLDIQIDSGQMDVVDRENNKRYASAIVFKDQSIAITDQQNFYPEFVSFLGGVRSETVGTTELLLTTRTGYEGEGTTYKFRALK